MTTKKVTSLVEFTKVVLDAIDDFGWEIEDVFEVIEQIKIRFGETYQSIGLVDYEDAQYDNQEFATVTTIDGEHYLIYVLGGYDSLVVDSMPLF